MSIIFDCTVVRVELTAAYHIIRGKLCLNVSMFACKVIYCGFLYHLTVKKSKLYVFQVCKQICVGER